MPDSKSPDGISPEPAKTFSQSATPPRRNRWRLRILLAIIGLLAIPFVVTRLEPSQVAMLGPAGQYVYELFYPFAVPETSLSGKRLIAEVKALGGQAGLMGRSERYVGLFGNPEQFFVSVTGAEFDDQALERLVNRYGDCIWALDLRQTKVTDDGLRHLAGLSQLGDLTLGNDDVRIRPTVPRPISTITDAGLIHLQGLRELHSLSLVGLPITDAGLDAVKDLPALSGLCLSRTKIKGPGLARLKSLPMLASLDLEESEIDDEGLSFLVACAQAPAPLPQPDQDQGPRTCPVDFAALAGQSQPRRERDQRRSAEFPDGAPNLRQLSLNGVPLTGKGLKALEGLPRLRLLNVNGSGLLDEDLMGLHRSKPALKIERR